MKDPRDFHGTRNKDGDLIPSMEEMREKWMKNPDAYKKTRGARSTCTRFKYCHDCKAVEPVDSECFTKEPGRNPKATDLEVPMVDVFEPYWDHALGKKTHGGLPVYVRSRAQRKRLLEANGLMEVG